MHPFIGYNTYHHKFQSKSFSDSIKYKGTIMKNLQESNNTNLLFLLCYKSGLDPGANPIRVSNYKTYKS